MNDALLVCEVERASHAGGHVEQSLRLDHSVALDARGQRLAIEQLQDEKWRAVLGLAEIEDADNARMLHPPDRLGLVEEAMQQHFVAHHLRLHDLEGDLTIDELVARRPNRAARAGADKPKQPVAGVNDIAFLKRHGRRRERSTVRQATGRPVRPRVPGSACQGPRAKGPRAKGRGRQKATSESNRQRQLWAQLLAAARSGATSGRERARSEATSESNRQRQLWAQLLAAARSGATSGRERARSEATSESNRQRQLWAQLLAAARSGATSGRERARSEATSESNRQRQLWAQLLAAARSEATSGRERARSEATSESNRQRQLWAQLLAAARSGATSGRERARSEATSASNRQRQPWAQLYELCAVRARKCANPRR